MNKSQSVFIFLILAMIVSGTMLTKPLTGGGSTNVVLPSIGGLNTNVEPSAPVANAATAIPSGFAGAAPSVIQVGPDRPGIYAEDLLSGESGGVSQPGDGSVDEDAWSPPPMEVPIAHQPWDHFWLIRPVAPSNNDAALPYYTFGSDGAANDLRIHHGVDLANPIGVEVYAAGDGTVIWAGKGSLQDDGYITAYGNTIVIQHDFGYDGEPVYTLYAHLSAYLVETGQRVHSGQVIGLIGNTGQVSGPHVHFEVRLGSNRYNSVYNPLLWMAPYVDTGVIAGAIMLDENEPAQDATVTLIDQATGKQAYETTSYAGQGVRSDPNWHETFVIPDVPEGRYLVTAAHDAGRWSAEVTVVKGTTNWADMARTSTTRTGNTDPDD